jgi:hypothetical protein
MFVVLLRIATREVNGFHWLALFYLDMPSTSRVEHPVNKEFYHYLDLRVDSIWIILAF